MSTFRSQSLKQTLTYWPKGTKDVHQHQSWDSSYPIEIKGRWEQKREAFTNPDGTENTSRAVVYTDRELELGGWLFLGEIADLNSAQDPQGETNAFRISDLESTPNLRGNKYVYKVRLT